MKYMPFKETDTLHTGYQQQVKEKNIKRIFDLIRVGKCKSRAELVRTMGLSATSVSVLVDELTSRGLIREIGPRQTMLPGRRPISLSFESEAGQLACFELGRGNVRYTLLTLDGTVIEGFTVPFVTKLDCFGDAGDEYTALFEDILFNQSRKFDREKAIFAGVSFPGLYDGIKCRLSMRSALNLYISEAALHRFQVRLGLPMLIANTPMCRAYAEKKRIDSSKPDDPETLDLLYFHVGALIGGAVIVNGALFTGPYNTAGTFGHISIDYNGRPCVCGNRGCLERYVSLPVILEDIRQACLEANVPAPENLEEAAGRYPGDPVIASVLDRAANLLAHGIFSAICGAGITRVVLGGGIEVLGSAFLHRLYRCMLSRDILLNDLDISFSHPDADISAGGLAQYYLDKLYTITC